jgi:radical S-adenosyl methionine domain-containing protein 2
MEEIVINYHITERCNYNCIYCFAKYNSSEEVKDEIYQNLNSMETMLKEVYNFFHNSYKPKRIRLNLAGGEPLIIPTIDKVIDIAYKIGYEVSIITNGSKLTEKFIKNSGKKISVVGISIDSFIENINIKVGRCTKSNRVVPFNKILEKIMLLKKINPKIVVKINTVVTEFNWKEEMFVGINSLEADKWKIFKELPVEGRTSISENKFNFFIKNNVSKVSCKVFPESNDDMTHSYLMIDPFGRFYQNSDGKALYSYSQPIIEIGAEKALKQVEFNLEKFKNRYMAYNQ